MREFCQTHGAEEQFITAITASELLHGVERATPDEVRERRRRNVEGVLTEFEVLDFDMKAAWYHAEVWARLSKAGTPIGSHDLLIAAIALRHGFALVTLNVSEFRRVP